MIAVLARGGMKIVVFREKRFFSAVTPAMRPPQSLVIGSGAQNAYVTG
jgi:hypothetical protein